MVCNIQQLWELGTASCNDYLKENLLQWLVFIKARQLILQLILLQLWVTTKDH